MTDEEDRRRKDRELDDERTTNPNKTVVTVITSAPKKTASRDACLVVIYGDDLGRRIPLAQDTTVIGRSSKCQVQIDQESVSRNHARIQFNGTQYTIRDLGSTNGTYVNDDLIDEVNLRDGDQIKIGRTIAKFLSGGNIEANYHEEIYRLMTIDGLTEVHNRRYFNEALEKEASRCRRYDRTFALVMFDIDHFKKINDTLGHQAGDVVIQTMATTVERMVRAEDLVARYGGEEFAIVARGIDTKNAKALGERVRHTVQRLVIPWETGPVQITVSVGVASVDGTRNYASADELVSAADEALYRAKHTGRNRVCAAGE